MRIFVAILGACFGGGIGLVGGSVLGAWLMPKLGGSGFEGQSAYYGVFFVGLPLLLIGAVTMGRFAWRFGPPGTRESDS